MQITFIGAGRVGAPLAAHLARAGHAVTLAEAEPGSPTVAAALARDARLRSAPLPAALQGAEVVFLCTPFGALEALLPPLAPALAGKIIVDCTNPVGPGLRHGLASARSGSAAVAALLPGARVVKAFSVYGAENLEDPGVPAGSPPPMMPLCGDEPAAKAAVSALISACGFAPLDVGGLEQALHLEHMTLLWVRMVRAGGASPHLMWAALRR